MKIKVDLFTVSHLGLRVAGQLLFRPLMYIQSLDGLAGDRLGLVDLTHVTRAPWESWDSPASAVSSLMRSNLV